MNCSFLYVTHGWTVWAEEATGFRDILKVYRGIGDKNATITLKWLI